MKLQRTSKGATIEFDDEECGVMLRSLKAIKNRREPSEEDEQRMGEIAESFYSELDEYFGKNNK